MVTVSEISTATEITPDVVAAFARLLPQLSSSAVMLTAEELGALVEFPASHLLVARTGDDTIVGSMTLVVFPIPTGLRAWIEDVVVDGDARGLGVGEALNRHAIGLAHGLGARTIDLTSRPSRVAANNLYRKLGFVERETNVYRYQG